MNTKGNGPPAGGGAPARPKLLKLFFAKNTSKNAKLENGYEKHKQILMFFRFFCNFCHFCQKLQKIKKSAKLYVSLEPILKKAMISEISELAKSVSQILIF